MLELTLNRTAQEGHEETRAAGFRRPSLYSLLGLPLLYASAYFVPLLMAAGAYLLPSRDFLHLIIYPTLAVEISGALILYAGAAGLGRLRSSGVIQGAAIMGLAILTLIGLKSLLGVAGYSVEDVVPRRASLQTSEQYFKVCAFVAALVVLWIARARISIVSRVLASLGFALGALAAIRLVILWTAASTLAVVSASAAGSVLASSVDVSADAPIAVEGGSGLPRRVVWVIFDEADFDRIFGGISPDGVPPNFGRLARSAVFATHANSPASVTFYSIPSLLTGVPLGGEGVKLRSPNELFLQRQDRTLIPFNESTSVFGAIASRGGTASVLGFYHPYCRIFELQRCDSFAWPGVGSIDSAIWANVPNSINASMGGRDYWAQMTEDSLRLVPAYVSRRDVLTFIHLNLPHLPSAYADHVLGVPRSADPLVEYSRNVKLADRILGEIVHGVETQAGRDDTLLVVSADHWLRNRWYQAGTAEVSKRIPFIVWKVGEAQGIELQQPVSTVHTAAMILEYLRGSLTTQADIARWLTNQPVYATYMAPNT